MAQSSDATDGRRSADTFNKRKVERRYSHTTQHFALGCHYSNLLQKNFCQWFTSELRVQTLPRCCKTNSPHRCTLFQAVLFNTAKDWSKENSASTPGLLAQHQACCFLSICWFVLWKRSKCLKPSSKAHKKVLFYLSSMPWNPRMSGCKQLRTRLRALAYTLEALTSHTENIPNASEEVHGWRLITGTHWSHNCHAVVVAATSIQDFGTSRWRS